MWQPYSTKGIYRKRNMLSEYYTLITDSRHGRRFNYPICKREIAIEWALDTLKALNSTHQGAQYATLYLSTDNNIYYKKVKTFKRQN